MNLTEEQKNIIREIIIFLIVFVVIATGVMILVRGYTLSPGESENLVCSDYCVNDSITFTCESGTGCPECPEFNESDCPSIGVCEVDRILSWNETYTLNESNCDINVHCEDWNVTQIGQVTYPMRMTVRKNNNGTSIDIVIYDRNGLPMESWSRDMTEEDIVEYTLTKDFQCPANLYTDVNLESCSPFLGPLLNESSPIIYQLFSGSTTCMESLVDCQSANEGNIRVSSVWENKFEICDHDLDQAHTELLNCQSDTSDKVIEARGYFDGWVPGYWMYFALFLIVVIVLGGVYFVWQNNSFYGGGS